MYNTSKIYIMALENILPIQILLCLIIWHEFKHLSNLPSFGFIFNVLPLNLFMFKEQTSLLQPRVGMGCIYHMSQRTRGPQSSDLSFDCLRDNEWCRTLSQGCDPLLASGFSRLACFIAWMIWWSTGEVTSIILNERAKLASSALSIAPGDTLRST